MNPNHPTPEDFRRPDDQSSLSRNQRAELERQLKRLRPRPPELDLDAIVRSAAEDRAPATLVEPLERQRRYIDYARLSTVAGSWLCGAVVGALVTFALWRPAAPSPSSDSNATQQEDRLVSTNPADDEAHQVAVDDSTEADSHDDARSTTPPSWSSSESLVSLVLDRYGQNPVYGARRRPLRADDFARSQLAHGLSTPWSATESLPQQPDPPESDLDDRQDPIAPYAPAPAITRDYLLQDLLDATPDSLLERDLL